MSAPTINQGLLRRIIIPLTPTSSPDVVAANAIDPFSKAGQYALGWTSFCLVLVGFVASVRVYHYWTDKMRQALYKEQIKLDDPLFSPELYYQAAQAGEETLQDLIALQMERQTVAVSQFQSPVSSITFINDTLALFRWIVYRPISVVRFRTHVFSFPSLSTLILIVIAFGFITLYCFLPQPYYWPSVLAGPSPLAVRAGMMAVAMTPWIVATAMKVNLVSMITGISHERLNVLHRFGGYLCLFATLIHVIPFFIQPVWQNGGLSLYGPVLHSIDGYIYGTGFCALASLLWLCVGSAPIFRKLAYELFFGPTCSSFVRIRWSSYVALLKLSDVLVVLIRDLRHLGNWIYWTPL